MIVSGIDRLLVNVPNLNKALEFFVGMVGMKVVAKDSLDKTLMQQLWQLPVGISGRSVCVRNSKQPTAIEIVELNPAPKEAIRDTANVYDYGFFDIAYAVSDAEKAEHAIIEQGYTFYGGPLRYHIDKPSEEGVDVIEGLAFGPGKSIIAILGFLNPPLPDEFKLEGNFWSMFDMAQVVESVETGLTFYRDILGLSLITDVNIPPEIGEVLLHVPKGSTVRLVGLNHPQSNGPQVELLEISAKGRELSSSPRMLGIFMLSFESDNLDSELAALNQKGFSILSGPVPVNTALHGKVLAANVEGPSKLRVELFQKL